MSQVDCDRLGWVIRHLIKVPDGIVLYRKDILIPDTQTVSSIRRDPGHVIAVGYKLINKSHRPI